MTVSPVDDDQRAASLDLVAATRELMLAAGTSDLDAAQLSTAAEQVRELARTLGERRRPRLVRAGFDGAAKAREQGVVWHSFVHNPMAIPLEMIFEGDTARASLLPNALHEGPPDHLHGGFAAHVLDCLLGTLMQARGHRALTSTLNLRYLRRTPLDEPLEVFAELTSSEGRRHVVEGWISHDGKRTVEARGLFVDLMEAYR